MITILMPCLDERETLAGCIRNARKGLAAAGIEGEILIADNGSTDGSVDVARREGARVVEEREKGYGSALRAGIDAARGEWIVMGDADGSYDFSRLGDFLRELRGGADLVMGCRLPSGGGSIEKGAMPWKHRWIGNPILSFLGRRFFHSGIHDFHCGLRAFRRDAIRRLDLRTTGMEFASEMVVKSTLHGLKIAEVPITLHPDGRLRSPHLRSWRDGWRHLRFMLLFSPRWLFLAPGSALVVAGGLFGLRLVRGPIVVGGVGFDTNTLLVCAMALIVGVQLCLFGIFTRIFAITEALLPENPTYRSMFRLFNLERGLLSGAALGGGGFLLLVRAVLIWGAEGFGALPPSESARVVIPAVTLVMVGVQVIFSSFFLSILGLSRR